MNNLGIVVAWWGNSHQRSFRTLEFPWLKNVQEIWSQKQSFPASGAAQAALRNSVFLRTPWGWTELKEDDFFFLVVLQELEPFKTAWHHLWPQKFWIKQEVLSVQRTRVSRLRGCHEMTEFLSFLSLTVIFLQSQNLMPKPNPSSKKISNSFQMRNNGPVSPMEDGGC